VLEKPLRYTVRNYLKGDEVAIAKLMSECFDPTPPSRIRLWHRRSGIHPEDVFEAVADGKPVSHVSLEFKQLHHGEGVYLKTAGVGGVCTDSDYRKKGIVTHLMKLALECGQREGLSNASLFTGLDIPAHRLYQRLGFVDVMTLRTYTKYVDYSFVFARWLRFHNRLLKDHRIAAKKLEGWEKSVVVQLGEAGTFSFKFRKNRFRRLRKPPKRADVEFSTDLETYTKLLRAVLSWEDAIESGKLVLKRGEPADVEMVKRILHWSWEE
jgi:GNAT superfamily N-acetyltransferase